MTKPEAYMTDHHLKKQSQFAADRMNVSVLQRKDYERLPAFGHEKTKPICGPLAGRIVTERALELVERRVAASKPKALGMVNAGEAIPKLRLRLPRFQAIKSNLTNYEMLNPKEGRFTGYDFEKTKPICRGLNECNIFVNNVL
jgi:hypothetical protein